MRNEDLILWKDGADTYCATVMGDGGEIFGVQLLAQPHGYEVLMGILNFDIDPPKFLALQQGATLNFVSFGALEAADRAFAKSMGHTGKSRFAAPEFRALDPARAPWFPDESRAALLARFLDDFNQCFDQALQHRPELVAQGDQRLCFWRDADSQVRAELVDEPEYVPPVEPLPELDQATVEQILRAKYPIVPKVELTVGPTIIPVGARGTRPYFPKVVMLCEPLRGMVLLTQLEEPWTPLGRLLQNSIVLLAERTNVIPGEVRVADEEHARLLQPICAALKIRVKLVDELPAVEAALDAVLDHLSGM